LQKQRPQHDDEDPVRIYLSDIGRYPLLTKVDEVRLAKVIEAGTCARMELASAGRGPGSTRRHELRRRIRDGEEAQKTFVIGNLRLVVSIAKKYQASGLPLLDLIQEGNLGLIHAVEKFDWRKGFKFSTYATWWIRQAITRGVANTSRTVRLPVHAGDTIIQLQKARSRLELKLGRPPTQAELAIELELPEDKVIDALRFALEPLSLSEPRHEDGDGELGDFAVQPHQGTHPPDRGAGDVQAPPPEQRIRRPRSAHGVSRRLRWEAQPSAAKTLAVRS